MCVGRLEWVGVQVSSNANIGQNVGGPWSFGLPGMAAGNETQGF